MVCSVRTPILVSFTLVLAVGAPLLAQRTEADGMRRTPRAEPADTSERQLRRLERKADSLAQLYNESEELSVVQRKRIGEELDRTVAQLEDLARQMAAADERMVRVRVQVAPMMDEREATAMSSALRQAQESQLAMPRGWLGLLISGTARVPRADHGELIVRYLTHPVILSVDPSSPAEKAGLVPGDTLLAYDGHDVRDRDISMTRLLVPNARVLVRIRRDGRTKEVPVTIADVPSRIRLRSEANFEVRAPRPPAIAETTFPRGSAPQTAFMPRRAPPPPMPVMPALPPMRMMIFNNGSNTVAGAQLAALTEGLARTVGVKRGVLVTYTPVGSPASLSGLKDGDVIVRVGGEPVLTVAELREQVQMAAENGESSVVLDLVRERKSHRITLRWNDR